MCSSYRSYTLRKCTVCTEKQIIANYSFMFIFHQRDLRFLKSFLERDKLINGFVRGNKRENGFTRINTS